MKQAANKKEKYLYIVKEYGGEYNEDTIFGFFTSNKKAKKLLSKILNKNIEQDLSFRNEYVKLKSIVLNEETEDLKYYFN